MCTSCWHQVRRFKSCQRNHALRRHFQMRTMTKAAALAVMLAIPGAAFAAQATAAPAVTKSAAVAKHTTSGVVKSATDSSLVITKGGKEHTFVVNSSTEKKGT